MPQERESGQSSVNSAVTPGGIKDACQECRLNKIKCLFAPDSSRCHRCEKHDFDCSIVTGKKRGRKPKSKVAALGQAAGSSSSSPHSAITRTARRATRNGTADGRLFSTTQELSSSRVVCPLLTDHTLRNRAWQVVARVPATRGSTYNFVSAGDADLSTLRSQRTAPAATVRTPPSSRSFSAKPARTTLRSLLQPVLYSRQGPEQHESACTSALPRTIDLTSDRDLQRACSIDEARCTELVAYFMQNLQPWVAVVSFDLDQLRICPLLFTTVCYQASRYSNGPASETAALATHCRKLCVIAFAETQATMDLVLAFYLLSAWKTPDDDFSDFYMSYADQVARHLAFGSSGEANFSRDDQRIHYFHYVQRHVFLLHHGSTNNYDRYTPGARGPKEFTKRLLEWSQSPEALPGDWFLCADVESTSIQCRYALAFTERHDRQLSTDSHSIADTISSKTLLDDFVGEMVQWEDRWLCEGVKAGRRERGSSIEPFIQRFEHKVGFGLFKNSVIGHVASYALKDALRTWLQEKRSSTKTALSGASLNFTEEYLSTAYLLCLEGMLGILHQFAPFRGEDSSQLDRSQSCSVLHAPDSLVILADHAALMIVYLLLLPGVLAELLSLSSQNAATPHIASMARTADTSAQDCIDTLQQVKDQMEFAAVTRSSACTAVRLSAQYLVGLIELAGRSGSTKNRDLVGAQATDTGANDFVDNMMLSHTGGTSGEPASLGAANGLLDFSEPSAASVASPTMASSRKGDLTQESTNDAELFHEWLQSFLRDSASDGDTANGSVDLDFPMPSFM